MRHESPVALCVDKLSRDCSRPVALDDSQKLSKTPTTESRLFTDGTHSHPNRVHRVRKASADRQLFFLSLLFPLPLGAEKLAAW